MFEKFLFKIFKIQNIKGGQEDHIFKICLRSYTLACKYPLGNNT